MRDVTWGDVIMSIVIVSILNASLAAATFFVLHSLVDWGPGLGIDPIYIVMVSASLIGSLLIVRAYPGPKSDFGPWWAWILLLFAVPALGYVSLILRGIDHDTLSWIVSWWLTQMSVLTLVIFLSIFLNTRDSAISLDVARTQDF